MLYNGIGLQSSKGSSTSGRVEKNLTSTSSNSGIEKSVRKRKEHVIKKLQDKVADVVRLKQESARIALSELVKRRQIEARCEERRIKLECEGVEPKEIDLEIERIRIDLSNSTEVEYPSTNNETQTAKHKQIQDSSYTRRYDDNPEQRIRRVQ